MGEIRKAGILSPSEGDVMAGVWQFTCGKRGEDVFYLQGFDFAWLAGASMRGLITSHPYVAK